MDTILRVPADAADARLDVFLARSLEGVSRTKVQKAVKAGTILLNGKKVTPHIALSEGDEISLPGDLSSAGEGPAELRPRPDIRLDILHEDEAIVVVNKPSGLLVHPTVRSEDDTLANALVAKYPEMAGAGEGPERPGIMQRLDKDASGALVVARTDKAYRSLKKQFQDHSIKKEYLVLVHGKPPDDEGTVTLAIGRAESGDRMAARHEEMEGDKPAVTHYRVLERFASSSLLSVRTETGRTHQIRAHFKALGCPVAGDPLYKGRNMSPLPVKRLFLHAATLGFKHPVSRKKVEFTAPLPPELEETLNKLRTK